MSNKPNNQWLISDKQAKEISGLLSGYKLQAKIDEILESLPKASFEQATGLQLLLDQPEGEPVARLMTCKKPLLVSVETIARTYEEFSTERAVSEGFWAEGRPLYTHPTPFTPITADDVTDEMVDNFNSQFTNGSGMTNDDMIVAAVNAYLGSKK